MCIQCDSQTKAPLSYSMIKNAYCSHMKHTRKWVECLQRKKNRETNWTPHTNVLLQYWWRINYSFNIKHHAHLTTLTKCTDGISYRNLSLFFCFIQCFHFAYCNAPSKQTHTHTLSLFLSQQICTSQWKLLLSRCISQFWPTKHKLFANHQPSFRRNEWWMKISYKFFCCCKITRQNQ